MKKYSTKDVKKYLETYGSMISYASNHRAGAMVEETREKIKEVLIKSKEIPKEFIPEYFENVQNGLERIATGLPFTDTGIPQKMS